MGSQIIRQPDGKLAVFSTEYDRIMVWDATEDEIVEWFAADAAVQARRQARWKIELVAAGKARQVYAQRAMTWDEATIKDCEHGGSAWKEFING